MAVIAKVINGTNLTRDAGIQEIPSALISSAGGVRKGYKNECMATSGQVDTGIVYVPVIRTNVTPNEEFLVVLEITEAFTLDTSGNGYIVASVNQSKINDGSSNSVDGSGIGTIEKVGSLPSSNYTLIATIASGVVTYAPTIAHLAQSIQGQSPFVYADIGTANAYHIVDDRVVTLEDGYTVEVKAANTNAGGASTFQVNSLTAKSIRKAFNQVLDATDIQEDQFIILRYDLANDWFQMMNPVGNPSSTPNITVRVSSNDTTSGYLNGKLVGGNRITLIEDNDGSNETLTIAFNKSTPYTAGETLVADDWVYLHTDNKVYKGDYTTIAKANYIGVVTTGGATNATVQVQETGIWTPASYSLTAGTPIFGSSTAGVPTTTKPATNSGSIVPVQLGVPSSSTRMKIDIKRFQRVLVKTNTRASGSGNGAQTITIGFPIERVTIDTYRREGDAVEQRGVCFGFYDAIGGTQGATGDASNITNPPSSSICAIIASVSGSGNMSAVGSISSNDFVETWTVSGTSINADQRITAWEKM